jgi:hypothetical protein
MLGMCMKKPEDKPFVGKYFKVSYFHDFSFSGKSPEITLVLQQIKNMLFIDEFNPIHPPIVYPKHEYLLHHILYPSPA